MEQNSKWVKQVKKPRKEQNEPSYTVTRAKLDYIKWEETIAHRCDELGRSREQDTGEEKGKSQREEM